VVNVYEMNCIKSVSYKKLIIFFGAVVHTVYTDLNCHVCVILAPFALYIKCVLKLSLVTLHQNQSS
jgi:hypothetical protein